MTNQDPQELLKQKHELDEQKSNSLIFPEISQVMVRLKLAKSSVLTVYQMIKTV